MKIAVQWTKANPTDWEFIDSADWGTLPAKPVPVGGEVIDNTPGWVTAVCIQGVTFEMDHISVMDLPLVNGCKVFSWYDDTDDTPASDHIAVIHDFLPLAPDPAIGGRYNTRQTFEGFGGSRVRQNSQAFNKPMQQFNKNPNLHELHAINMPDELYAAHKAARTPLWWRDWTDGVPLVLLDENGRLR